MREGNKYKKIVIYGGKNHLGNTYSSGGQQKPTVETLLADLFLTDASGDRAKTLRHRGKEIPGTCEWVLRREEFTVWASGNDWELLWLIGAPGIGKTVIFCFLVEELEREVQERASTILIYYLCDNDDKDRSTATAILRGILVQLLKQRPALFELIKSDYALKKTTIVGNLDALWRPLLAMLKKCGDDKVYILIDALDECEELSRGELLTMLRDLVGLSNTKILITGRPESDILETAQTLGRSLRLDSGKINDDLSKFINIRVDELERTKTNFPAKLIEDIRTALQDKAGGTFLWASLLLRDISSSVTTREAKKKLNDLPSDLPSVYERLLKNIKGNLDDVVLILQWVVVSRRPMTVCELATAHLLAAEEWHDDRVPPAEVLDEFMDGFKACGPLLYHDPDTDTINLVHQSAKDYLAGKDCLPPQYRVNRDATNLLILNTCWTYLCMREFQHGTVIIERSEDNELGLCHLTDLIQRTYGFLRYSTEELRDGELTDRLDSLSTFIHRRETLHYLPTLRDFWFIAFVEGGHIEGVQSLIKRGADPSVTVYGEGRRTALHIAAEAGNDEIVRLLLEQKVDVLSRAANGDTALHLAAQNGFSHICRVLIDHDANPNAKTGEYSQTALHLAVHKGHMDVVTILLQKGAKIDEKNGIGNTAFMEALSQERADLALFLLEKGADPEIKGCSVISHYGNCGWNGKGEYRGEGEQTALIPAARRGHYKIVKLLLEKKIDVDERTWGDHTALSIAVENGHVTVANLLIDGGG